MQLKMKIKRISTILILAFVVINCSAQSLNFTNNGTWANIGDIDIQGNQITVEALIYMSGNNTINVVSKHVSPSNVNYLLRPLTFELTTYVNGNGGTTQFLQMWNPFTLSQNKWYHIAGTYNGSMVKYYVDGCLVIEQPFNGNLYQNDFLTAIGNQSNCQCEQFLGKIDEVRIWNVCRTQDEIRNNMLDLPNPNLQAGLISYYKLDNSLINNQGNSMWNGTLVGNIQYSNDQANIQPFAITDMQILNADCEELNNGSVTVSTNRLNTQYSLNGNTFQVSNVFSNLGSGSLQLFAKSPEGCVIDSILTIGNNDFHFQINNTESICQGGNYLGYSTTGIYIDTLYATIGCDSIRTINLTVLPNVTFSETISICQGGMYAGYSSSGTYVDVFTAANGCDSTRTLILVVKPNVTSTIDTSICQGGMYAGYSSSGTYVDVFTAANGCDSIRTLTLIVNLYSEFNQSITICSGSNYNFNGQIISTEGTYLDTIANLLGCDSIITLDLIIAQSDFLGNDTTICIASEHQLISPSNSTRWFDNEIVKIKKINETGIYWAAIFDTNGCEIVDTIFVQFNVKTYIPNVFSPNDDGINDCFQPFFSELGFSFYRFSVFDRWGSHIYSTNNPDDCWNGEYRGRKCNPGVYVYFVEIKSNFCERTVMKGDITLLE
jgi:gliding motility-associated-like protein